MTLSQLVRAALDSHHDGARAGEQQAYMKSSLPFRGIGVPEVLSQLSRRGASKRLPVS